VEIVDKLDEYVEQVTTNRLALVRKTRTKLINHGTYQRFEQVGNLHLTEYAADLIGQQLCHAINSYGLRRFDHPVEISKASCGGQN